MRGTVGQDSSGKWFFRADLPKVHGKRRQVRRRGFDTKREASRALNEFLTDLGREGFVEPSKLTVADYLRQWLRGLPNEGLRPTTVASYEKNVRLYIEPAVGGIALQALTAVDLNAMYAAMGERGLSARTRRFAHSVIRRALRDAVSDGLVTRNVADLARPPKASAARPPRRPVWTPEELAAFLDFAADSVHFPLIRVAAMTGMRRGELCGLPWRNVDLDGARITVTQNLTITSGNVVIGRPKTEDGNRVIAIDPETVEVLRRRRQAQREDEIALDPTGGRGYWANAHGLVFTQPDGSHWNPKDITRGFIRLVERTDLPRISLHDLRHSHATHLLAAGTNLKVVAERLGHADEAFTLRTYAHALPNQQEQAALTVASLVDTGKRLRAL